MNYRTYIALCLFLLMSCFCASAQDHTDASKKVQNANLDTTIPVPDEFDNVLDHMLHSWIVQRSTPPSCTSSDNFIHIPDSICKVRMSKMPCLMEMPYNSYIQSFIDLYTVRKRLQMEHMLGMSSYYFPIFEQVLSANNLPLELKYLSIIESALNTTAVSRVGAAGLWQLMIGTARMYGLEVNSLVDERLSPVKATNAAARFLKDLYSIYGDWNLVIASYNCGPGNVNKAIRRSGGKRDYWAIYPYLPRETRGYVPIFVAANYSMHYASDYSLCPASVNMPEITDTVMVNQRFHLEQVAAILNLPIEEVRLLNPQYRRDIVPGDIKPYEICLPLNSARRFTEKYNEIVSYKADSLIFNRRSEVEILHTPAPLSPGGYGKVIYHKVKAGQSLSGVAAKYGISVSKLKKWNHIRGSHISRGQRLKILK